MPSSFRVSSSRLLVELSSVISHGMVSREGFLRFALSSFSGLRPQMITRLSNAQKDSARARPMPDPPPVISTVLLWSFIK